MNKWLKKVNNPSLALVLAFAVLTGVSYQLGASASSNGSNTAGVWSSLKSLVTGSGAPSGTHYELEIIGVPQIKTADMTGNNGHRIFVGLGSQNDTVGTKIMLQQSTDGTFGVLDANGTDGSASFKLPAPGSYTIWARALGKPGGSATLTTCATDPLTGLLVCSTQNTVFVRGTGGSKFKNVTLPLTTIQLDPSMTTVISACGATMVSLFDPCLQDYFWQYDNNGLKNLQVRFYPN